MRLIIEDDGCGIVNQHTSGFGIVGMRERVSAVGGVLTIQPALPKGLRVEAILPIAHVTP